MGFLVKGALARALAALVVVLSGLAVVGPGVAAAKHRAPIVSGVTVVTPRHGTEAGRPGTEGTAAGHLPNVFGRPAPFAGTVKCNPVPPQSDSSCNLTYHNGDVMRNSTTHIVYWAPSGYSYPAGYQSLIEQYLTDVAHDHGDATFTDAVSTQYYDTIGGGQHPVQNNSPFAGSLTDTTGYPANISGCTIPTGAAVCLTQKQETDELDSFINSKSGTRGTADVWFLILPPTVQTCYNDFSWCGPYGGGPTGEYCAYHSSFTGGFGGSTPTVWANMVYAPGEGTNGSGCPNQQPNNNVADHTIDVLSHEMNESMTDPRPSGGWVDDNTTNGGENGDQCNFVYGSDIGSTANGSYDELINGHPYRVQQEWDNSVTGCSMFYGAADPTASFNFSPASPHALDTVNFDGTASHDNNAGGSIVKYSWDFGDGNSGSGATPTHAYATSGTFTVTLTVTNSTNRTASVSHDVTVVARPTTVAYTGATSGDYNDSVTLSATLTDNGSSTGIAGKTIHFSIGAESCDGTTGSAGDASCSVTPLDDPGPYTVAASFTADSTYGSSSDSKPFTVNKEQSHVAYTGATTVHYHDPFTASATLTDPDGGAPIAGKQITFTLGSGDTCSANTDNSGNASCSIKPTQTGNQTISASFAGDTDYVSSSDSGSFSITPEETTMKYTGPKVILAGSGGATLTATMLEDGTNDGDGDGGSAAPNPAEQVTLALGAQTCTGTTDSSGNVSCTIPHVTVPLGPEVAGAAFAGDAYYQPSSDSATVIVFAFPSGGGAFALGDKTASSAGSSSVTWWGSDWSSLNSLSAGAAPNAFKGFVDAVKLPTTSPPASCTPAWTSNPGNSSGPPASVPSYMGTLVTSKVTKSGSTIGGNTVHIVVVKTDPGYAGNPGHPGTGKIVATFC